jgi:hypothetical protein
MRRMRFVALGIVSFFAVLMGALLAPGTFVNRALSAALCTIFSFSSTVCTVNLAKSSDRVVAATPPALEKNIGDWLGQRSGEFDDDKPSTPPGNNPQVPPYPQDPGPKQPVRPDFNSGGGPPPQAPGPKQPVPPDVGSGGSPPPPDPGSNIDKCGRPKCDFSTISTRAEDQKCQGASGNQCEGGDILKPPQYRYKDCTVEMFESTGSQLHDQCCINHPEGYACGGYGNRNRTEAPHTGPFDGRQSLCEAEWTQARDDSIFNRGHSRVFGPYTNPNYGKECSAPQPKTPEPNPQPQQPQQIPQQEAKICRIPDEFWESHKRQIVGITMTEHICVIQGSVMTHEGMADGQQSCGACSRFGDGLPPSKVLCSQPEDPARTNPVSRCPVNWSGQ